MTGTAADSITRRIQQAIDIVDLVSEHVRLKRAGKDWRGLCPFHQEKTPSFYVAPAKQIFKCFGCGAGGDVFKFVQLRERVGFPEARAILAAKAGISLEAPGERRTSAGPDKATLAKVNDWALRWFRQQFAGPGGEAARAYAERRGLTAETIQAFDVGFAPAPWEALRNAAGAAGIAPKLLELAGLARPGRDGSVYDTFRNRLMFPIRDVMQRVVGFGGRTLGDDPAKYLNTPETALFDKARCLFGLDKAKAVLGADRPAVVVEGYLDCIIAHQHGFTETVATLGTALGPDHANILRRYTDSVVLLFDSDEAGIRAADRALPIFLSRRIDVRLARVPQGKDPADFLVAAGAEAFRGLLITASDALESKWNLLTEQFQGASSVAGRGRAVEEFLASVAPAIASGSVDPIHRGLILNQLSKLLGIAVDDLQQRLTAVARREPVRQEGPASASARTGAASDVLDAGAKAARELLEVLLNEPGCFDRVRPYFDPAMLRDAQLERIGRRVLDVEQNSGVFELGQLLAETDDVDEARLITDLAIEGERRGNFEATIDGAIRRVEQERLRLEASSLRDAYRDPSAATEESDAQVLVRLGQAREHRHFAPRKALKSPSREAAGN